MSVQQHSVSWQERYRAARTGCGHRLGDELADVASDICNPVVKLRFLRDVIDNRHRVPMSLKYTFLKPLGRAILRVRSYAAHAAHATRARLHVAVNRIVVASVTCCAVLLGAYSLGTRANNPPQVATLKPAVVAVAPAAEIIVPVPLPPVAESMPTDVLGIAPTTIWLADRGTNWELYSNGLRIETGYAVAGEPRRYRVHERERGVRAEIRTKPVGILFHTSESDIWPLDASFEKQLRTTSAALIGYVRQQRAYNYVIDRYGRVYRVVDDETRANHAGHGVWASGNDVYMDLNSAMLGVSFETRWEGGQSLPITRAQLLAGRNLTNYLRQRFAIAPEMCVTHGLTSVSPKQHLIGYHTDWARGFPFAAFGLPDQYVLPPPSIALFGFEHSDELARAVGDGWPGIAVAESALAKEAQDTGVTIEVLRSQRQALFGTWAGEARANDDKALLRTPTTNATASTESLTEKRG